MASLPQASRSMSTAEHTRTKIRPLLDWRASICHSELSSTQRHVLLTLSLYMGPLGDHAWPGSARLAKDTALHVDTVKRALKAAVDEGWLRVIRRGSALPGQPRLATEYQAALPESHWGSCAPSQSNTGGAVRTTGGSESGDWGAQGLTNSPENSSRTRAGFVIEGGDVLAGAVKTQPPWVVAGMTRREWTEAQETA